MSSVESSWFVFQLRGLQLLLLTLCLCIFALGLLLKSSLWFWSYAEIRLQNGNINSRRKTSVHIAAWWHGDVEWSEAEWSLEVCLVLTANSVVNLDKSYNCIALHSSLKLAQISTSPMSFSNSSLLNGCGWYGMHLLSCWRPLYCSRICLKQVDTFSANVFATGNGEAYVAYKLWIFQLLTKAF